MVLVDSVRVVKAGITGVVAGFVVGSIVAAAAMDRWKTAEYLVEKAELTERVRELERYGLQISRHTQVRVVEKVKKVYVRGRTIVKGIPIYVTQEDDRACELRNGFVRVYDSSLRDTTTGPASESDRTPSGVALSRATETIIENNTEHLACREKLLAWQQFYEQLKKKYE